MWNRFNRWLEVQRAWLQALVIVFGMVLLLMGIVLCIGVVSVFWWAISQSLLGLGLARPAAEVGGAMIVTLILIYGVIYRALKQPL